MKITDMSYKRHLID